jgi:hypothetical protein
LGHVLADSQHQTLIDFVRNLDRKEIMEKQRALLSRPISDFVANADEARNLVQRVLSVRKPDTENVELQGTQNE